MYRFILSIKDLVVEFTKWVLRVVDSFFVGIAKQVEALTNNFKR